METQRDESNRWVTNGDLRDTRDQLAKEIVASEVRTNNKIDSMINTGQALRTNVFAFVGAAGTIVSVIVLVLDKTWR